MDCAITLADDKSVECYGVFYDLSGHVISVKPEMSFVTAYGAVGGYKARPAGAASQYVAVDFDTGRVHVDTPLVMAAECYDNESGTANYSITVTPSIKDFTAPSELMTSANENAAQVFIGVFLLFLVILMVVGLWRSRK